MVFTLGGKLLRCVQIKSGRSASSGNERESRAFMRHTMCTDTSGNVTNSMRNLFSDDISYL